MPPPGLDFNRVLGVVKDGAGIHLLCDAPTADDATAPTQAVLSVWQRPWRSEDGAALFSALPGEYSAATSNDKHTKAVVHGVGTADLKMHHMVTAEEIARYTPSARVELRETAAMYAKVTLPRVVELKRKYYFRLIVDETLSVGVLGGTGRGTTEHFVESPAGRQGAEGACSQRAGTGAVTAPADTSGWAAPKAQPSSCAVTSAKSPAKPQPRSQ